MLSRNSERAHFYLHIEKLFGEEKEVLTRRKEKQLIRLAKRGDEAAMDELIRKNYRMVLKFMRPFLNIPGIDPNDLFQEGLIGVRRAVMKFKLGAKNKLMTYAVWWVRLYLIRHIQEHARNIRIPLHVQAVVRKMRREALREMLRSGVFPSRERLSQAGKIEKRSERFKNGVFHAYLLSQEVSLDSPVARENGEKLKLLDLCHDDLERGPGDTFTDKERLALLKKALFSLSPKEEFVLRRRFFDDYTLTQTAMLMRKRGLTPRLITRERVRQIEAIALRKLKKILKYRYKIQDTQAICSS